MNSAFRDRAWSWGEGSLGLRAILGEGLHWRLWVTITPSIWGICLLILQAWSGKCGREQDRVLSAASRPTSSDKSQSSSSRRLAGLLMDETYKNKLSRAKYRCLLPVDFLEPLKLASWYLLYPSLINSRYIFSSASVSNGIQMAYLVVWHRILSLKNMSLWSPHCSQAAITALLHL